MDACWEPVWGILPMVKVLRKEAWHTQRHDLASGVLLDFPEHLPPKTRVCLPYYTVLSTLLKLTGAIHHHLFLEKVNLELQLVSCIWKECFSSNPSDGSLTCLTGLTTLVNCLWPPQPWEARSLKHLKDIETFLKAKNYIGDGFHCWVNDCCQASKFFIF